MPATPRTSVVRTHWYVTAHTVRPHIQDGQLIEVPVSQAHAKRLGTMVTACGVWADSWRKLYDLAFPLPLPWRNRLEACPECSRVVADQTAFRI